MSERQCVAICCYRKRDIRWNRCTGCQPEYGCLGFRSSAEILHFNELIPASMLGEPLPLNLWPNLWKAIEPETETSFAANPTPVQLLVEALGLRCPRPPALQNRDPQHDESRDDHS
jgi:hypothetical protein